MAVPPELAEVYQLDLWLNPHGFLKSARLPGANPVGLWRWEQLEKGRDGNVVKPEKMHVVAITMLGKYRVDATINSLNQIQRIKTTVNIPAFGDFNIEHESTDQLTFGNVKWPIAWHSHQGWDDNWQFYGTSTGHNAYGGTFPEVQPNVCDDPVPVPLAVAQATFATPVTVEQMAERVYLLGGGPANSYMVEFNDFVAVFEAPVNEERSLAVIEEVVKLAPNKPIRWLITSHPHFDHIGGLRTYLHIGSTIVTHMANLEFLNRDVLTYAPRTVEPDIVAKWPPTELAEGYTHEAIQENYVITDDSRILRVYYVQPLRHVAGMLMAYLPNEQIVFQADLFDIHEPPRAAQLPAMPQSLQPGGAHEAEGGHARTRARKAGSLERVLDGTELAELDGGSELISHIWHRRHRRNTTMAGQLETGESLYGESLYEVELKPGPPTEYGVSMEALMSGQVPPPPEGVPV